MALRGFINSILDFHLSKSDATPLINMALSFQEVERVVHHLSLQEGGKWPKGIHCPLCGVSRLRSKCCKPGRQSNEDYWQVIQAFLH